jgi:S1-C subfamily serine protease
MRRALAAAAALVALAGASGCGGDDDGKTTTVTRTTTGGQTPSSEPNNGEGAVKGAGAFDAQAIYRRDATGVVTILAATTGDPEDGGGLGSGFVVSDKGEVVTNAHVVTTGEGAAIRQAREVFVKFADGNQVPGKIVGFDPFSDVALVKIDPDGLTLRPLALGSVDDVAVGEPVAAIGSPFGEERSLSVGVISALERSIQSLTGFSTSGALQTDAAINSGNSGGPLLDAQGRVLGINSQIRSSSGTGSGVGFAVPVDVVRRSLAQLRETGSVKYPYLGISTLDVYPQLDARFRLGAERGSWVQVFVPGGPAARAGLRAGTTRATFQEQAFRDGGDVIVKVGDVAVRTDADLSRALEDKAPGQTVQVAILRDGKPRTLPVRLGTRPLQSPRG